MAEATFYKAFSENAAENYERYFVPSIGRPLATRLINSAELRPGDRVLDIATGTGVIARLASEKVVPGGSVTGLDLNPGMIAVAREVSGPDSSIEWHESSAESMPFANEGFDVILCQLGLQFMEDKPAALREMYRVLTPDGQVVISVGGPTPEPFSVFADAIGRHINPRISPFVHMVFSLDDPEELRALLGDAGFSDISVQTFTPKLLLPPPAEFMWQYIYSTPMAEPVNQASEASRAALEQEVVAAWQAFTENGGMTVSPRMLIAIGRK